MFKLVVFEPRSCRCGYVRGHLQDNSLAWVNGKGLSLCIDNRSLVESGNKLPKLGQNESPEYYAEQVPLECYVRPHAGPGNPRSKIRQNLDSSTDVACMLSQAVRQFRQEHSEPVVPQWVEDAERILKTRRVLPRFEK